MKQLRPLVLFVLALAVVAYVGGICWAGVASIRASLMGEPEPILPEIVVQAITAIGGLLATHFGAVFGISVFTGDAADTPRKLLRAPRRAGEPPQPLDWLQVMAAYVYVGSILLAVVFWGIAGFSPTAARSIVNLSFTLIGVAAGIGAVALNVRHQ